MIPSKQTVAHIQKDCWRHGGKSFDEDRWVNELKERRQGTTLRKYELLKEAQTKGNARHDAAAKRKHDEAQNKTKRICELEGQVQELKDAQGGAKPANPNATTEDEKERRRMQSERDKFLLW